MTDLTDLYSKRILALAADIPHTGILEGVTPVKKRSPLCGSTVTAYAVIADGRVVDFAQTVRACALGQASASVLGAHALGRTRTELEAARAALVAMLSENGPTPPAPFEALEVLRPAAEFPNRHPSVLLAWDALIGCFDVKS
ncbi:MAG: iron-sulfur cluster assembly scaffold protein [Rhodobacterales bacterium]|nr:MAG: iron-sulfur cluster assembly scaffold protein [Rhodobacterales bacterium]